MQIACVRQGPKYGEDYVLKLQAMVKRHLPPAGGHEFVCYTDQEPIPGVLCERLPAALPGWWAKASLFKLREPLVYFDLDVVITGSLAPLLQWEGFGIIKDWWLPGYNSSVMVLTGREGVVWDKFTPDVMRTRHAGDQQWITECLPGQETFPAAWFPSWKANRCGEMAEPAPGSIATIFHGSPKPDDIKVGWVPKHWRQGR